MNMNEQEQAFHCGDARLHARLHPRVVVVVVVVVKGHTYRQNNATVSMKKTQRGRND